MATKYVRNIDGGVHSVDEDFLEERIKEDRNGRSGPNVPGPKFLPHGWSEITEEEALAESPQLFGAHDTRVIFNAKELRESVERAAWLKKYEAATKPKTITE
jgi:hypothetical protein